MPGPLLPRYDDAGLAAVLPAVLASLESRSGPWALAPARRVVVVLVDGLGLELLERRRGHAPFLRSLLPRALDLTAGFPTTTATSMGTFGTGLPPGAHGLTGYQVRVPGQERLLNELTWENGPEPERWQPHPTIFERAAQAGIVPTMVAPAYFDNSGLTRAALRGANFRAAGTLADRVDATLATVRASPRALVYLYWGELDRAGHSHGVDSPEWGAELERIDAELRRLTGSVPRDCSVAVTADHGMVDVPPEHRIDLAVEPDLADGVLLLGGEMRSVQVYCAAGAAAEVYAAWCERLGDRAWIRTREEAVAEGWFGPVTDAVLPRLGEVIVAAREDYGILDSRVTTTSVVNDLIGQHGSLTPQEMRIPLLHQPAADAERAG